MVKHLSLDQYFARFAACSTRKKILIISFLLEQIYSILVSGFLSYNQFKVSQFLEIEQKRNCNVFRVGGGLGLYRGGMC